MADEKSGLEKDLIRELADLLGETGLSEIEIERKGFRIRVARTMHVGTQAVPGPSSTPPVGPSEVAGNGVAGTAEYAEHAGVVKSPMVGTAYRAPEPGAPPFVDIGTTVREGDTLIIVEAMKTMNHIPAPRSGKITVIMVEDGDPVEYGEPLVVIE